MKAIWLVDSYLEPTDETSRQAILARYIELSGYKAYVICANADSKYFPADNEYSLMNLGGVDFLIVNIEVRNQEGARRVLAQVQFQQMVLKYGRSVLGVPDVIINNFAGLFGDFAYSYKRNYGTKIILDVLDLWPEVLVENGYLSAGSILTEQLYRLERRSYERADSIFFSIAGGSDYIAEKGWDLAHGGTVDLGKVRYINNGVDLERIDSDRLTYRLDDPDLDSTKYKVGYIGSVSVPNDIGLLIETAQLASNRDENSIVFLVYGSGSMLEEVKVEANKRGLKNIKFKGRLEKKYFPSTIGRCDLALLNFENIPALRYGLSNNKFFMYCASRMPILSTVHPGHSIIEERACGVIVDHTPQAVLEGILRFKMMSPSERGAFSNSARKVAEDYDYSVMFGGLLYEIENLVGKA